MNEKLLEIINHYGVMKQLKYLHTEYFELDEAIISAETHSDVDHIPPVKCDIKHIADEIADIQVMLNQLKLYYGIDDSEIVGIMNYKIQRQIGRIKSEELKNIKEEVI